MKVERLINLVLRHLWLVLGFPLATALLTFVLVFNKSKLYYSEALLYTGFASGYNLESPDAAKATDYIVVNSAFDNLINTIKLRSTLEEVSLRMLTRLALVPDPTLNAAEEDKAYLEEHLPPAYRQALETLAAPTPDLEAQRDQLFDSLQVRLKAGDPQLRAIVYAKESPLSVHSLSDKLEAARVGSSDLIKLSYAAKEPHQAQTTLNILFDTFIEKYRQTKTGEAGSVVAYFEKKLDEISAVLARKEDSLKLFKTSNQVLDYEKDGEAVVAQQSTIENELQQERSRLAAAEAALQQLNTKMNSKQELQGYSAEARTLRTQLTTLNDQLTLLQVSPNQDQARISRLQQQISEVERKLGQATAAVSNSSRDGVTLQELHTSYNEASLDVERSRARIRSLQGMQSTVTNRFQSLVPLRTELNRLEREIELVNTQRQEVLRNLNASRLRERNITTSSNLRILDEPSFPDKPSSLKNLLLVMLSFIASAGMMLGLLVGKELLDTKINDAADCTERTGLPFAGALPSPGRKEQKYPLSDLLLNQCLNRLQTHFKGDATLVLLYSTQAQASKTFVGQQLVHKLKELGYTAQLLSLDEALAQLPYQERNGQASPSAITDPMTKGRLYFVELEPVAQQVLPPALVARADLSLVVVPAGRNWTRADDHMLAIYRENVTQPAYGFLNGMEWNQARQLLGRLKPQATAHHVPRVVRASAQTLPHEVPHVLPSLEKTY
ncbi:Uncharacterized protein involved in exopolysaccharide biosynthesis [Catalinimonas alkaloidigena]|uniref:Uncharacterized protein involved in exopolysaccharide biosynthesis n=1 Tax=Catalinimonas alkaloidigena TaxID=1075417 RepID=A0A1G9H2Z4_9BACT|nr:hypothetical protein [Catalinimonas alkaloidigena]SDL07259.1 Uncharacterized protein involved in exopolysaccharide biosynthesis [Catalinimonas alkaloidigena]